MPVPNAGLPLSIAAIAWRAGMTAILKQTHDWVDLWAPPEIVGGIHNRSADYIHNLVMDTTRYLCQV